MWVGNAKENREIKNTQNTLVVVAIDKDKGSQHALKWAIDHLLIKGQTVVLLHVRIKSPSAPPLSDRQLDAQAKELFLPFRCFCTMKNIQCKYVIIEGTDVARTIIDYVTQSAIEILIMGSASKGGFLRFNKVVDLPSTISKGLPDFCSAYIISKGKVSSRKSASRQAPQISAVQTQIMNSPNSRILPYPCSSVKESRSRHHKRSRMDPRRILLVIAIMACMATMGILYYRIAQGGMGEQLLNERVV